MTTTALLAVVVAGLASGEAQARSWSARLPRPDVHDGTALTSVAVAGGKVWSLRALTGPYPYPVEGYALTSRRLDGAGRRTIRLDLPAMQPPPGRSRRGHPFSSFVASSFRVRGDDVVLVGGWSVRSTEPRDGDVESSPVGALAVFDARSGQLLRQDPLMTLGIGVFPVQLLGGSPATLANAGTPDRSGRLWDPVSGETFGARYAGSTATVPGAVVFGRYVLGYRGGNAANWGAGTGRVEVADLRSGHVRYRLRASQISRLSGGGTSTRPFVTLAADGSVAAGVERRRGTGLTAVTVNAAGAVRRFGRRIKSASMLLTLTGHHRVFVYVRGRDRVGGKSRECEGLWMTNEDGTRGVRLAVGGRTVDRQSVPMYWDGRFAVWASTGSDDSPGVRVDNHLEKLKLLAGSLPSCAP